MIQLKKNNFLNYYILLTNKKQINPINKLKTKIMNTFNKYQFIEDLNEEIIEAIKNGNCKSSDDYYTLMHERIDYACIYYSDCFDICKELNATDFTEYDIECSNICQLAYAALYQYSLNELNPETFDNLILEIEENA
jgi:hypothetical protein